MKKFHVHKFLIALIYFNSIYAFNFSSMLKFGAKVSRYSVDQNLDLVSPDLARLTPEGVKVDRFDGDWRETVLLSA